MNAATTRGGAPERLVDRDPGSSVDALRAARGRLNEAISRGAWELIELRDLVEDALIAAINEPPMHDLPPVGTCPRCLDTRRVLHPVDDRAWRVCIECLREIRGHQE